MTFELQDSSVTEKPKYNLWGNGTLSKILQSGSSCNSVFCDNSPKIYLPAGQKVTSIMQEGIKVDCDNPPKVYEPEVLSKCDETENEPKENPVIESQYSLSIEQYANQYNVNPKICKALVYTESKFNPKAKAGNTEGLMQISPDIAKQAHIKNRYNPEENLSAGIKHFSKLVQQNNGDYVAALSIYKEGQGNYNKHGVTLRTRKYLNNIAKLSGEDLQNVQ